MRHWFVLLCLLSAGCGCGDDDEPECHESADCENQACIDGECAPCTMAEDCFEGGVCNPGPDGALGCYDSIVLRGRVFDITDGAAIEGARVVAVDVNGAPASTVSITDAEGRYELSGVPATRGEEGEPVGPSVTLRADAVGYETFPGGIRQALPVDATGAADEDDHWAVDSAQTEIGLIPVPAGAGTASIHGTVEAFEGAEAGALVVADAAGVGTTGIADVDGDYAIFNLAPGNYSVQAYTRGVTYETVGVDLAEGQSLEVDIAVAGEDVSNLSGKVEIVNPGAGSGTSIILVVESTFDDVLTRGATPPGLRAPYGAYPITGQPFEAGIRGDFVIEGVPPGRYVALAAFENDFLVRDPDVCIAGTDIVHVEVPAGQDVVLDDSFKVTGALDVVSPGAVQAEAVTTAPTLSWGDDSSEDQYDITVFDVFGNVVWQHTMPGVSGGDNASVDYAGPLDPGMFYQFKAVSSREPGGGERCNISQTEDLKGVFFVPSGG